LLKSAELPPDNVECLIIQHPAPMPVGLMEFNCIFFHIIYDVYQCWQVDWHAEDARMAHTNVINN